MEYRAIMEGADHCRLTAITGEDVTPLTVEEIAVFQTCEGHGDSP